jgi:dTDP-4-amino-4,6-dideoxygalactose transaminase
VQSELAYLERLVKFAAFKVFLTRPVLSLADRYFRLRGQDDYEEVIGDSVRNIASLTTAKKLRKRCPAGMLALLLRRLEGFRPEHLEGRRAAGRVLLEELGDSVLCPGSKNAIHNFWAFPIVVNDPKRVMKALRDAGFDAATLRRSTTVRPPADRPKLDPVNTRLALERLIVLPCYEGMPEAALRRQAAVVRAAVGA